MLGPDRYFTMPMDMVIRPDSHVKQCRSLLEKLASGEEKEPAEGIHSKTQKKRACKHKNRRIKYKQQQQQQQQAKITDDSKTETDPKDVWKSKMLDYMTGRRMALLPTSGPGEMVCHHEYCRRCRWRLRMCDRRGEFTSLFCSEHEHDRDKVILFESLLCCNCKRNFRQYDEPHDSVRSKFCKLCEPKPITWEQIMQDKADAKAYAEYGGRRVDDVD